MPILKNRHLLTYSRIKYTENLKKFKGYKFYAPHRKERPPIPG